MMTIEAGHFGAEVINRGLVSRPSLTLIVPAGASGRNLPFWKVIRSPANVTSPVIDLAVVLTAVHFSPADAAHAPE
jgi:hypothetical protein